MATSVATQSTPRRRSRRTGYGAAVLVNAMLLIAVNVWPGWSAVPFLTDSTTSVLPLINLSLVAGIAANLVYLINDSPPVRSFGDFATSTIALVVVVRLWQDFPFDVSDTWQALLRVSLVLVAFGCAIGALACLIRFISQVTTERQLRP